ncbi:glycosyltransferase family 2 protein [Parabacteroides merdae]|uniref:glycosyltransferase family 2 protein n=2 Tax=Bacteroidia TaxID=200643 RepID=UPI0039B3C301
MAIAHDRIFVESEIVLDIYRYMPSNIPTKKNHISMAKVSVVIPVYGVEAYIRRCARSLFGQTLNDMEFIFVDDFTPDRSIDLLKKEVEQLPPPDGNKCASSTCHRTWERRKPAR